MKMLYEKRFLLSIVVLAIFFIIGRWSIWNYFPFALIYSDSCEYFELAFYIHQHQWPSFHFIGGGYPLFIALLKGIYDHPMSVVYGQQFLSFFSVILLLYSFRNNIFLFLSSFLFGVIYLISDTTIKWEIAIFTESLFSSLFLLATSLLYLTCTKKHWVFPLLLGFIFFYVMFMRSSAIFVLPIAIIISTYLLWKKNLVKAGYFLLSLSLLCFLLAFYNLHISLDHQFSILTYGRFKYQEGVFVNSKVRKNPDIHKESAMVLSPQSRFLVQKIIKQSLPHNNPIHIRYFSWDLAEYTKAIIRTRYGVYADLHNDSLFVCARGNGEDVVCNQLFWNEPISNDSMYFLISNYSMNYGLSKIKSFLAFHHNLKLNYDQAYFGMAINAYRTMGIRSNNFISSLGESEEGAALLHYILGKANTFSDTIGFENRWAKMSENFIFRLYDKWNERINKKIFRNVLWVLTSTLAFVFTIFQFLYFKRLEPVDLLILFLGFLLIGSSLIFTFYGNPLPRYSFSTEFCYYLITLLFVGQKVEMYLNRMKH